MADTVPLLYSSTRGFSSTSSITPDGEQRSELVAGRRALDDKEDDDAGCRATGNGTTESRDYDIPEPHEGEILVKMHTSGSAGAVKVRLPFCSHSLPAVRWAVAVLVPLTGTRLLINLISSRGPGHRTMPGWSDLPDDFRTRGDLGPVRVPVARRAH